MTLFFIVTISLLHPAVSQAWFRLSARARYCLSYCFRPFDLSHFTLTFMKTFHVRLDMLLFTLPTMNRLSNRCQNLRISQQCCPNQFPYHLGYHEVLVCYLYICRYFILDALLVVDHTQQNHLPSQDGQHQHQEPSCQPTPPLAAPRPWERSNSASRGPGRPTLAQFSVSLTAACRLFHPGRYLNHSCWRVLWQSFDQCRSK